VTQLSTEESTARPVSGRAFFKRRFLALPGLEAQLVFWPLLAAGIALDLWTKKIAFEYLEQQATDSIRVINGFLQLVRRLNKGAAFGIAEGQTHVLIAISALALVVILAIFFFSGNRQRLVNVALGLFAAGVCGNLYDRIFHNGSVRDFIDVVYWPGRHWPAFNAADSMLCVGVGLLIIANFLTARSYQKHARQHR